MAESTPWRDLPIVISRGARLYRESGQARDMPWLWLNDAERAPWLDAARAQIVADLTTELRPAIAAITAAFRTVVTAVTAWAQSPEVQALLRQVEQIGKEEGGDRA